MTSERRKAANRANARYSTGPKTLKGKAAVRLNAVRHGLLGPDVLLPGEDGDAFDDLRSQMLASLSPEGPIEKFLVNRVVDIMWRLGRLERAETALFHSRVHGLKAHRLAEQVASYQETFLFSFREQPKITDAAAHSEASEALRRAEYERDRDEVLLGRAIDADARDGDAFTKLARYERSLERSLYRALDEFRNIRDERQNRLSPPILDATMVTTEDPNNGL